MKKLLSVSLFITFSTVMSVSVYADESGACSSKKGPSVTIRLPNTTQGPFWPPSELLREDGEYVVVGSILTEVAPGVIVPILGSALVSKNTVPALDEHGIEDTDNWFGAPYDVIRPLDLSHGSEDLNLVLYSNSYGPAEGNHGGTPRIPRAGDSAYNLNGIRAACPELFPAASQRFNYTRPSYPLHKVPVWGFQGDQVVYDVDTGEPRDANASTGPGCELTGCPGEDIVDQRRRSPITLGDWLNAKGRLKIQLTRFDKKKGAYTHARFTFKVRDMIPEALYTIWALRPRRIPIPGVYDRRPGDPLGTPNVIYTDSKGAGQRSFEIENPFPDPATDIHGRRIFALGMIFHSDYQNWGACFSRFGPGVDLHPVFNTLNREGGTELTSFITVAPDPNAASDCELGMPHAE